MMSESGSRRSGVYVFLGCLLLAYGVGFVGAQGVNGGISFWYLVVNRPPWALPGGAFTPLDTVFYGLQGLALWSSTRLPEDERPTSRSQRTQSAQTKSAHPKSAHEKSAHEKSEQGRQVTRAPAYVLYGIQLVLFGAWPWLFFFRHALFAGTVECLSMAIAACLTCFLFLRFCRGAALLMLPQLVWALYLCSLSFSIWRLNASR